MGACAAYEDHRWVSLDGAAPFCRICGTMQAEADALQTGASVIVACPHEKGTTYTIDLAGASRLVLCEACWRKVAEGVMHQTTSRIVAAMFPEAGN